MTRARLRPVVVGDHNSAVFIISLIASSPRTTRDWRSFGPSRLSRGAVHGDVRLSADHLSVLRLASEQLPNVNWFRTTPVTFWRKCSAGGQPPLWAVPHGEFYWWRFLLFRRMGRALCGAETSHAGDQWRLRPCPPSQYDGFYLVMFGFLCNGRHPDAAMFPVSSSCT